MKKSREEIQQEISNEIVKNNWTGLVDVACRVGKTKISLDSLNRNFKITIIYPEVNIKQAWINDIKKFKKRFKSVKYSTTRSISKLKDYSDVVILDEIHAYSTKQLNDVKRYLSDNKIICCLGLSGSLSDESKQEINEILGLNTIYKYSITQAISDEIITDYLITVISTPLDVNKTTKVKWSGGEFFTSEKMSFDRLSGKINDWQSYSSKQLKMMRLARVRIIMNSKAKINLTKRTISQFANQRILVFTGLTSVADDLGIKSYHSKTDEIHKDAFLNQKINHLAIVNKLNTGVTFPKLDVAILNYYNSNTEVMCQKISRVMNMDYTGKIANIIIISSNEEVEKKWLNKSLALFDSNKIKYL